MKKLATDLELEPSMKFQWLQPKDMDTHSEEINQIKLGFRTLNMYFSKFDLELSVYIFFRDKSNLNNLSDQSDIKH